MGQGIPEKMATPIAARHLIIAKNELAADGLDGVAKQRARHRWQSPVVVATSPATLARAAREQLPNWFYRIVLATVLTFACTLAASTYSVFSHTWDEPEHLAAGLKLLDSGEYPYDVQHPPLARLAMAIGPYLAGARPYGNAGPSGEQEGRDILYRSGHYDTYLTLARVGMLPFLALLILATWLWARHTLGAPHAVVAAFFVATTPPVIGHAAVAALDVPMAATTMFALYLFVRWHDAPNMTRALAFGVAAGLAAGTKLSAIPFLACATVALMVAWRIRSAASVSGGLYPNSALLLRHGSCATLLALVTLIMCYGIGTAPLSANFPIAVPVGIPRLLDSLRALTAHNADGHWSYFMGEGRRTGWWSFYIVALGVKTPLPLLLLGATGIGWMLLRSWRTRNWNLAAPALAFLAILLFSSIYSQINIGVRHVMVLFPLLALAASFVVIAAWRRFPQPLARATLAALLAWQLVSMARAQPDNLAYFNELAGAHPERIVVDSDLDWGQDMRRLEVELAKREVTDVSILYRGTADLLQEHLPHWRRLSPNQPVTGWIAVSLLAKETAEHRSDYAWLNAFIPVARVGKSIDLYYVQKIE